MKFAAPAVLVLALALHGCTPGSDDGGGGSAKGGSGGGSSAGGTGGGSSASGGSSGSGAGGSSASGGSSGSGAGGSSASGGSSGAGGKGGSAGGSGGKPGSGGATADVGGGSNDGPAAYFKSTCGYPVMSGYSPLEFCTTYAEICTFTGANRYASMADCMTKFKGMSSDADACKAGHLCRAYKLPMLKKESDCASAGTGSCSRSD